MMGLEKVEGRAKQGYSDAGGRQSDGQTELGMWVELA